MNKKIAVRKNDIDFCRIIPIKRNEEGGFEIKISPFSLSTIIKSYKFLERVPEKRIYDEKIEVTYHIANEQNKTKIHVKRSSNRNKETILEENLIDLNINHIFPIPLFKVFIPDKSLKKQYKRKSSHISIDLENNNYAEFYLINSNSPFLKKDHFIEMYMPISLEYLASNNIPIDKAKARFFQNLKNKRNAKFMQLLNVDNNLSIIVIMYKSFENSNDTELIFIENEYSKDILLLTRLLPGKPSTNKNELESVSYGNVNFRNIPGTVFGMSNLKINTNTIIGNLIKNNQKDKRLIEEAVKSQIRLKSLVKKDRTFRE